MIFYGVRNYGRVDAHAGEHAQTQFFHVYWLPLFPTGSSWVTGPKSDGTNAHGIKLSGKSVLSGYLRIWGAIIAIANAVAAVETGKLGHAVAAAVATLATVWAWSTLKLRGAAAQRRSDFNYVAFGTRCEPKRMLAPHRVLCKKQLDERWRELAPKHSPNEVAQHGAANAVEAVLAYGLLRLSSLDRGGTADGAAADRILDGRFEAPSTADGPYRAGPAAGTDAATAAALAELVSQRAQESRAVVVPPDPAEQKKHQRRRRRWQAAGLALMTMASVGGTIAFVSWLRPAIDVGLSQLRSVKPPMHRIVNVTCDSVDEPDWEVTEGRKTVARIAMCHVGKYLLPLELDATGPVPWGHVTGKLREVRDDLLWVKDGLRHAPELEMRTLDVYLDTKTSDELAAGLTGLGLALVTCVLWILWFRARRRQLTSS